jgi:uncharacterized membrane protein YqaE (UPF0057 family)
MYGVPCLILTSSAGFILMLIVLSFPRGSPELEKGKVLRISLSVLPPRIGLWQFVGVGSPTLVVPCCLSMLSNCPTIVFFIVVFSVSN